MENKETKLQIRFSIEPSKQHSCVAILTYAPSSTLVGQEKGEWSLDGVRWSDSSHDGFKEATVREVPITITHPEYPEFDRWRKAGCIIKVVEEAPTFERFWNMYGYKVGNKTRVQKKWNQLPEGERILAMAAIPRYKRFAQSKCIDLVYPETYIDQRRWENEFTNN